MAEGNTTHGSFSAVIASLVVVPGTAIRSALDVTGTVDAAGTADAIVQIR
jgi:hypothetical protein